MASTLRAPQACRACRRLKRKCSKEVPSCSLCFRLDKTCEYENSPYFDHLLGQNVANQVPQQQGIDRENDEEGADLSAIFFSQPNNHFPTAYFLDTDLFTPLDPASFLPGQQPIVQQALTKLAWEAICNIYLSSIHTWLPILSRKRLLQDLAQYTSETSPHLSLLLLCMKLCTAEMAPEDSRSSIYSFVKTYCSATEMAGFASLRLVQSLVLLAVYELGHTIYPAAYLTIGRAARLGGMMGMHNRKHAQQLFVDAETLTLREEQRRTWWAIVVFDRLVNCGTRGMPFAAPDPGSDDLLPINDLDWKEGRLGMNEPLLTPSFRFNSTIGPFARTCQATHILGKVIRHQDHKDRSLDVLSEAIQLHHALVALEGSLSHSASSQDVNVSDTDTALLSALALCCSARFLLYNQYGCNEPETGTQRMTEETEMQQISLQGIRELAARTVPFIARQMSRIALADASMSPLVSHSLYHAATECAWFINEDHQTEMYSALADIVGGLQAVGGRWQVGAEYLSLLERGKVLALLDSNE